MWRPSAKIVFKSFAAVLAAALIFWAGHITGRDEAVLDDFPSRSVPSMPFEQVLDGDTIVDRGRAIHIAGIDAPELGPWARCWAEAGLAGFSKDQLEIILTNNRGWHIVDLKKGNDGRFIGKVIDKGGYDIADDMHVYGGAAMTSGHWDWCKTDPKMHNPEEGERPPIGPQLWWPSGSMFDKRAAD